MIEQTADIIWFLVKVFIVAYGLCYIVISLKKARKRRNKSYTPTVFDNIRGNKSDKESI